MEAMVVGGGIGGLAAGIALRRAGADVVVFERAARLGEIGAGLGLYPNAVKALGKLGLRDAVMAVGRPLRPSGQLRSWRGDVLLEVSTAVMEERFGAPAVGVHRAALHGVLLDAFEASGGKLRLGAELTGFRQDAGSVVATFVYGAGGTEERADLLVGADGLRSRVREVLLGDGPPLYAGYSAWRGLVGPVEHFLGAGAGFESWGPGSRFGLVALGGGGAYWFATKNAPDPREVEGDGPSEHKAELRSRFGGWHRPIPSVIEATADADVHFDGVYHREPAERWGEGRATLLGDAAHPMTPDLGQGACQAVEDAVALGEGLEKERGDPVAALRAYEGRRMGRTAHVVRQSLRAGRVAQSENPSLRILREVAFKVLPRRALLGLQLRQMGSIVGHEE